jgi:hypothetical protein
MTNGPKPFWTRVSEEAARFKLQSLELQGIWRRLADEPDVRNATTTKVLVLILRQLTHITGWLVVIAACSFVSACCLVVG